MKAFLAVAAISLCTSFAAVTEPRATPAPLVARQQLPDTSGPLPSDPASLKAYTESVYAGYASIIANHPEAKDNILSASSVFQRAVDQLNSLSGEVNSGDVVTTATYGMNGGPIEHTTFTQDGQTFTPVIADDPNYVSYSYGVSTQTSSKAAVTSTAPLGNSPGGALINHPGFAAVLALAVAVGVFLL